MGRRMMFCKIISHVINSFVPFDVKLTLGHAVTEPVVFHVPTFTTFHTHFRMHKTISRRVVGDNLCAILSMSHTD